MKITSLSPTLRFALFLFLIATFITLARVFNFDVNAVRGWLAQYPLALSATLFIVLYVALTSFLWIGTMDLFRISGAILFGPYWGTLFIWIAEILNAAILFTISRKLGQEFVLKKLGVQSQDIDYTQQKKSGFLSAFVLRINPLVPFRFMDLGFGLSKISFEHYMWAVVLGSPVRIFMMQFMLSAVGVAILKNPMVLYDYLLAHQDVLLWSGLYLLLVFVATIIAVVNGLVEYKIRKKK